MKKQLLIFFAMVMLSAISAMAQTQSETPKLDKASASKIAQLLEESGHAYGKASANVWTVKFKGNNRDDISVIVIGHEGMLIMVSVVAEQKDFKASPELMMKLLRLNDDYDRLKVGIDDDGDLFVRIDLSLRVVDAQEFKTNVEQISAAADEILNVVKPYLVSPDKKPGQ